MNLLYIPAVLLMACFVLYPLARGVYISFFKWNGYSQNMTFIGLKNYLNQFAHALGVDGLERIGVEDLVAKIFTHESSDIVT